MCCLFALAIFLELTHLLPREFRLRFRRRSCVTKAPPLLECRPAAMNLGLCQQPRGFLLSTEVASGSRQRRDDRAADRNPFTAKPLIQMGHPFRFEVERKKSAPIEQGPKDISDCPIETIRLQEHRPVLSTDTECADKPRDVI
jgi:hypothetical protein